VAFPSAPSSHMMLKPPAASPCSQAFIANTDPSASMCWYPDGGASHHVTSAYFFLHLSLIDT